VGDASAWEKMKTKLNTVAIGACIPLLWIILLWGIFSSPYILRGNIPFPTTYLVSFFAPWNTSPGIPVKNNAMPDVITQIYPWKKLTIDSWKLGQIPLWNPYSFSGSVHAANYQSAVFSPVNLLFFVFPFMHAWSIMVLLQPLMAGLSMLLLLRIYKRSMWAQIMGSVAFMFCGFMVTWMAYGTLGFTVALVPLILWGIEKYMEKADRRYGIPITLGLVFSFLSGHFQMSVYVFLFSLSYAVFVFLKEKKTKAYMWLFVFILLSLLVSLPQLWLSYDAFGESFRQLSIGKAEVIPWRYFLTFFSPDFYGNPVTRNDTFGHYAEWGGFIGVVPFLLAFFALQNSKASRKLFFLCAVGIALLMAYASPISEAIFLFKVPVLSTSAASRIIVIVSFSLAVLSSFGLDEILELLHTKKIKKLMYFSFFVVCFLGIFWIATMSGVFVSDAAQLVAQRNSLLPTAILGVTLLVVAGMVRVPEKIRVVGLVMLLGIVSFDSLRFASKWMPFESSLYLYPKMDIETYAKNVSGLDRVFGNLGNEFTGIAGLLNIEGYDALYQKRYGEFIKSATSGVVGPLERSVVGLDKHGKNTQRVLDLLGVTYVIHKLNDGRNPWAYPVWEYPTYSSIYKDAQYEVFKSEQAVPRIQLVSSVIIESDPKRILDTLYTPTFDPRDSVIVEAKPAVMPEPGKSSVRVVRYSPNEIVVQSSSDVPKLLSVSDVFDKGWKAYVDGKETTILRANYDFRAVAIAKGKHDIVFRYMPNGIMYGMPLALVGVLTLGLLVVVKKKI
jgi:uncharacterized membrane protein YfhO